MASSVEYLLKVVGVVVVAFGVFQFVRFEPWRAFGAFEPLHTWAGVTTIGEGLAVLFAGCVLEWGRRLHRQLDVWRKAVTGKEQS
jgi:hypothetical protein